MATEDDLRKEFDTLKADVNKLRGDVSELVDILKELGTEKTTSAKASVDEELARQREKLRATLTDARTRGRKAAESMEGEIAEHPMSSLIAAFGLGFVIAKLLEIGRQH
ncbi:MAG TPA: hypothetical protein VKA19_10945 [Alphaproteobacteria bacterium]|nr:hypothetical protein [Alphaproteobacteria bacterium]